MKTTEYYKIEYDSRRECFKLWLLNVNLKDKLYPISWRWLVFENQTEVIVRNYQKRNFPLYTQWFKKD